MIEKIKEGPLSDHEDPKRLILRSDDADADVVIGDFGSNVQMMGAILRRLSQELDREKPDELRMQVYFSDLISIQRDLAAQQAMAVGIKGRSDEDVVRLQALLNDDLTEIQSRLESRVEQLEQEKRNLDARYAADLAKLDGELEIAHGGQPPAPPVDTGSAKGDDGGMEARLSKLESEVTAIKIDVAVIKANGATKSDLAELRGAVSKDFTELKGSFGELRAATKADIADAKTAIILWVVGAIFVAQILPAILKAIPELMAMLGK